MVFQANPSDKCSEKGEVKESLVRDGKDDENRGECEEDYYQAVKIVCVGAE